MSDFSRNWRKQQELRGREFADAVYCMELGAVDTRRFERDDGGPHVLDQAFAIDAEIVLATGQVLTCQEKFLSQQFSRYNSVTFEYMQNPATGEEGDWFRLCSEVYFISYFNQEQTGFEKWALLDVPAMKIATAEQRIVWNDRQNQRDGARASFRWADVGKLPSECVLRQQGFRDCQVVRVSYAPPQAQRQPAGAGARMALRG